jgi:hypothetical protein
MATIIRRMDLWSTLIGVISGLFGGAVGGVLTAGRITRSGEVARARFAAEGVVASVIQRYRSILVYEHDQVYEKSAFSEEYASIPGQEEFARAVLVELPRMSRKKALNIELELKNLVGSLTYALAVQRTYIEPDRFAPEREALRRALTLRQFLFEPASLDAILPRMLATQNDGQHVLHYTAALDALGRILGQVSREPRANVRTKRLEGGGTQ